MSQSSSSWSFSYSSTSSNINGHVSGRRYGEQVTRNSSGTTVRTTSQNIGQAPTQEVRQFDNQGREMIGGPTSNLTRRIEDVTDSEQAARDREYEERIEEEYAKREGGA